MSYAPGDPRADPDYQGESAYYLSVNRNKRGMRLDLRGEQGRAVLRQVLARSDILVDNFRAGAFEAMGFGDDALATINPRLIHLAITGYGTSGPDAARPGFDFIVQAVSGLMSITGQPDAEGGQPTKVGVAIADVATGMLGAVAILAALHARDGAGGQAAGAGQRIDLNLVDLHPGMAHQPGGQLPHWRTRSGPDGQRASQHHALRDVPLRRRRDRGGRRIGAAVEPVLRRGRDAGARHGPEIRHERAAGRPPRSVADAARRALCLAAGSGLAGGALSVGRPLRGGAGHRRGVLRSRPCRAGDAAWSSTMPAWARSACRASPSSSLERPAPYRRPPPTAGEHTDELLAWLGYGTQQVEALRRAKIV